jgi:soluble lytic murein transglycosylase
MKSIKLIRAAALAGLALALGGCAQLPSLPFFPTSPTPTASVTPEPTLTPTPIPTLTPTPMPTPIPQVRIESGERALAYGDWEAARLEFSLAAASTANEDIQAAARLGLGRAAFLGGGYREARDEFLGLIAAHPDTPEAAQAYFLLGQTYVALSAPADAAVAYLGYLALRPGVMDAYVLDLRADALFAAGDYTGAAADYQMVLHSASLLDPITIDMKRARSLALAGSTEEALALYESIYTRTQSHSTRALINLRKGQIYTELGQMQEAYAAYLDSVDSYPTAYEAYSGLLILVQDGVPVNELNRGLVNYHAGQYGTALAALSRYLGAAPPDPATAWYYTGLTYRASGSYAKAIEAWDRIIQEHPTHPLWDEAVDEKAFTQWYYLDQYTHAVEGLVAFVQSAPNHARAGEFLYDAALAAERSGRLEQAINLWNRVGAEYPGYENAQRALFLAGVTYYRIQQYDKALEQFQLAASRAPDAYERSGAMLWVGKLHQVLGDEAAAREAWQTAANLDPTGYYSERAADLLAGRAPFQPPRSYNLAFDRAREQARAEAWLMSTFNLPAGTDFKNLGLLATDMFLIRGTELWTMGRQHQARAEFEQLRRTVSVDPVLSYRLMNYLYDLGVNRSAIMTARQILDLAGLDDAGTLTAPAYFNYIRFGAYYSELVLPAAKEYNLHPLFVYSLIRQESLFESFVSSSAAAQGLMQIIPGTGQEIANDLGWPQGYTNSDLYRPVINVRFGVHYLNKQRQRFDGSLYPALAAYNGGPGNALAWRRLAPDDPDLYVEVVRFSETRTYIRRIYELFNIYRRIYDTSAPG